MSATTTGRAASGSRDRFYGLSLERDEGGTWKARSIREGTDRAAHVRATVPDSALGATVERRFERVRRCAERDYRRALRGLEHAERSFEEVVPT